MRILVTGAHGFIGKNVCLFLKNNGHEPLEYDLDTKETMYRDLSYKEVESILKKGKKG